MSKFRFLCQEHGVGEGCGRRGWRRRGALFISCTRQLAVVFIRTKGEMGMNFLAWRWWENVHCFVRGPGGGREGLIA